MAYTTIVAGDDVDADVAMANWNYLKNLFETGIIADLITAGAFTSAIHGDLSAAVTTMHSAQSSTVADPNSQFTGTNVQTVLQEIATFTGMGVAGVIAEYNVGMDRDDTTAFPAGQPSVSVVVPANAAPYGIKVIIDAVIVHAAVAAGEALVIPLNITNASVNPGDLSTVGSRVPRFEYTFGADNAASLGTSRTMWYLTTGDGWEPTIANTVQIGTVFQTGANMSATNFGIAVTALK